MLVFDLRTEANKAIKETIVEFRPSFRGGWRLKKPTDDALGFSSKQQWTGFLQEVLRNYTARIGPRTTKDVDFFASYKTKQLVALRDAIVINTTV